MSEEEFLTLPSLLSHDQAIASECLSILTTCANALEALPSPSNAALDSILEEIWAQVDAAVALLDKKTSQGE